MMLNNNSRTAIHNLGVSTNLSFSLDELEKAVLVFSLAVSYIFHVVDKHGTLKGNMEVLKFETTLRIIFYKIRKRFC